MAEFAASPREELFPPGMRESLDAFLDHSKLRRADWSTAELYAGPVVDLLEPAAGPTIGERIQ